MLHRLLSILFSLLVSFIYATNQDEIVIHLLTTNDIHGSIAENK
ncbi:uncharacterized protein METZ01_LOCUS481156, partial [marine metagenome]